MTLHAATIALSAFLLFLVQPIIARQILPWFGGSAAVWTTCMVFFQVALLAGYFYSDVVIRKLAPRGQAILHSVLLLASLVFLPITVNEAMKPVDASQPVGRILLLLAVTIGLPYLMLATTGPLVQAWFTRRYRSARVYRLYALSNLASMLALLGYPPLIEPNATGRMQSIGWSIGYAAFVALAIAAAWSGARGAANGSDARRDDTATADDEVAAADAHAEGIAAPPARPGAAAMQAAHEAAAAPIGLPRDPSAAPSVTEQALWLALAALGSTLLLAVTTHITQNVASIPFLWVLPLSLYLISFILCFDGQGWYRRGLFLTATCLGAPLMLAALHYRLSDTGMPEAGILQLERAVPLYALGLFVLCMFCHGELARRKPAPLFLTRFFLMVSLGGAAGGAAVGVLAPVVSNWYWELPVALSLAALLALTLTRGLWRLLALASVIGCLAAFFQYARGISEDTIELSRNFYGTLRVSATGPLDKADTRLRLLHGVIVHGEQLVGEPGRREPTTYYGASAGIGRAILLQQQLVANKRPLRVGLIGLGVGTLASYGRAGDVYRVYELNPAVLDLARSRFTYLGDSAAHIETPLGDARLVLEREAPQQFDVLAVDAFSSDSIPVHLITREAAQLYRRHLAAGGVLAFHITNRYLNLAPITRQLADAIGMTAVRVKDDPDASNPLFRSDWVLITGNAALVERLKAQGATAAIAPEPGLQPWTDDYNNLFQVLK